MTSQNNISNLVCRATVRTAIVCRAVSVAPIGPGADESVYNDAPEGHVDGAQLPVLTEERALAAR